jgi:hypothetical protein
LPKPWYIAGFQMARMDSNTTGLARYRH